MPQEVPMTCIWFFFVVPTLWWLPGHTHFFLCALYSCNLTWKDASEPMEGPWPEACRHLSPTLLKCLFITLFQLHLPLLSASHHANPNTLGLSRLIQSMISERREAFPHFSPPFHAQTPTLSSPPVLLSHCLPKSNALGENWVATGGEERKRERNGWIDEKKGRGRGLLHPAWAAKLVSEQQLDSRDAQHTLPTSCVCFCGV